ncbi:diguanylate cyclase [Panacagrimonas sp.]|uniref:GGDEF domain-containing protein n=1 Tax=Panacagrimonas sp. TaxID=2480088 RepID=UPI003B519504
MSPIFDLGVSALPFLPHGYCILWDPALLWSFIISHAVIGISYYSIPLAIGWFAYRQKDRRYSGVLWLFSAFIFACGTTHFIGLINFFTPIYRVDAVIMAVTAAISAGTAVVLWSLVPKLANFIDEAGRSKRSLEASNRELVDTVALLDRQRAETAASEHRFRLIFENAPMGLAMVGLDGQLLDVNTSLCRLLGYTEKELLGKSFQEITHPDDLDADLENVKLLTDGKAKSYRMEKRYFHSLGQEVLAQLDVVVLHDPQGRPQQFISQVMDVGVRLRAERELRDYALRLEKGLATLKRQNEEISLLGDLSTVMQTCESLDEMSAPISEFLGRMLLDYSGALYLTHSSRTFLELTAAFGPGPVQPETFSPAECWALRRELTHASGDAGLRCAHIKGAAKAKRTLCVQVSGQGSSLGVLYLEPVNAKQGAHDLDDELHLTQLLNLVADRIGLAVANLALREKLLAQSVRDPLTNLVNRRYLEEVLPRELHLAEREQHSVALMMIDVDHFKKFNDDHGHEAGDKVLQQIAAQLSGSLRTSDIACRLGGEEFTLVLPRTSLDIAMLKAEEIRQGVAQLALRFRGIPLGPVTISVGVACFPDDAESIESLMEIADSRLYQAKQQGRNRVVCTRCEATGGEGSNEDEPTD